jgi:hypothetical protein
VKTKVLVMTVAAFFVLVAVAAAFQWHMSYGQAKHSTREFAQAFCEEDRECVAWGVGPCLRRSSSRFDCTMGAFYKNFYEPGDEAECDIALHWGVSRSGYVTLKNHGLPNCHRVV